MTDFRSVVQSINDLVVRIERLEDSCGIGSIVLLALEDDLRFKYPKSSYPFFWTRVSKCQKSVFCWVRTKDCRKENVCVWLKCFR